MSDLINLYIRDKNLNLIRRIGDNPHDMLTINDEGQLCYYNLQNGGGCRTGEPPQDWYEFVCNEDMYGYNIDPREESATLQYVGTVNGCMSYCGEEGESDE